MKPTTKAARQIVARIGDTVLWTIGTETTECEIHAAACPLCGKRAIVALPPSLRAVQPDDTTSVCHPALRGCNQGFAANVGDPTAAEACAP